MKKVKLFITLCSLLSASVFIVKAQDLYPNFPEKFDTESVKDEYGDGEVSFKSGNWRLKGAKLVTKKKGIEIDADGTKGLQFISNNKGPMVAEMKFDLTEGASKITVLSSSYGEDATCRWRLQSSTDGGNTWKWASKDVFVDNKPARTEEFNVDFKGTVRFRIVKLALGNPKDDSSIQNGRLVIDNIAVYKK